MISLSSLLIQRVLFSWVTFLVSSSMSQLFLILPQWHTRANRMGVGGH